jgi:hypothetical protein
MLGKRTIFSCESVHGRDEVVRIVVVVWERSGEERFAVTRCGIIVDTTHTSGN